MQVQRDVTIPIREGALPGTLAVPEGATGLVVFAHGSGSSRFSPRNQEVVAALNDARFGTLLFDLLTEDEDEIDRRTRELRFNIPLLGKRMVTVIDWLGDQLATRPMKVGLFGASTGAAAALIAAAERPGVWAVVSRGGRPDLAGDALGRVRCPVLLIVGGRDDVVIGLNEDAQAKITASCEMAIVPGATHLFEEPGTMEQVTGHAVAWFRKYLAPGATP